jgi:hypothetical protein
VTPIAQAQLPVELLMTIWLAQTVVCIWLGLRTARRTGRSKVNWVVIGFLCAIPPLAGILIMLLAYFAYPEAMPKGPPGGVPERKGSRRRQTPGGRQGPSGPSR